MKATREGVKSLMRELIAQESAEFATGFFQHFNAERYRRGNGLSDVTVDEVQAAFDEFRREYYESNRVVED